MIISIYVFLTSEPMILFCHLFNTKPYIILQLLLLLLSFFYISFVSSSNPLSIYIYLYLKKTRTLFLLIFFYFLHLELVEYKKHNRNYNFMCVNKRTFWISNKLCVLVVVVVFSVIWYRFI